MVKIFKKAFTWYCTRARNIDACTPSCTIPIKYVFKD